MSNPKFRPRDLAVTPRQFGKRNDIVWRDDARPAPGQMKTAILQNHIVASLRNLAEKPGWDWDRIATTIGSSADRMGRLVRGELAMRVEDAVVLAAIAGVEVRVGAIEFKAQASGNIR